MLGKARTKNVGDLDQLGRRTNRAFSARRGATKLGISLKLRLPVTHLFPGHVAFTPRGQRCFSGESIIDTPIGTNRVKTELATGHAFRGYSSSPSRRTEALLEAMTDYDVRSPFARPISHVEFGPALGRDLDQRLIGDPANRRILDLGCGAGHTAVGLARRGARVIATDRDVAQLQAARKLAARQSTTIEFHQAEPAELAFMRAEQVDLVLSVWSLSLTIDVERVIRQVHRVLRTGGHFVISLPHPAVLCAPHQDESPAALPWRAGQPVGERFVHTAEELVTLLSRNKFLIDTLLERPARGPMPETLLVRGRRLGAFLSQTD